MKRTYASKFLFAVPSYTPPTYHVRFLSYRFRSLLAQNWHVGLSGAVATECCGVGYCQMFSVPWREK